MTEYIYYKVKSSREHTPEFIQRLKEIETNFLRLPSCRGGGGSSSWNPGAGFQDVWVGRLDNTPSTTLDSPIPVNNYQLTGWSNGYLVIPSFPYTTSGGLISIPSATDWPTLTGGYTYRCHFYVSVSGANPSGSVSLPIYRWRDTTNSTYFGTRGGIFSQQYGRYSGNYDVGAMHGTGFISPSSDITVKVCRESGTSPFSVGSSAAMYVIEVVP